MDTQNYPQIIQGGMGIAVSNWNLAKQVSLAGQLGVVSGTAIDSVIARKLQLGDKNGEIRRILRNFPIPNLAQGFIKRYFVEGGIDSEKPFKLLPKISLEEYSVNWENLIVSNYVEVALAKENHSKPVGINLLEKIQMATLPSIYGAMLAGVDYILMGAGIPREIPSIVKNLWCGYEARINIELIDQSKQENFLDPKKYGIIPANMFPQKTRPKFLAIISSEVLASYLERDLETGPDGYVVENFHAGGHNAPPRGKITFAENGEPIYGPRDVANFEKIKSLGKPFWIAGGYASKEKLLEAKELGAKGIQLGTIFALSLDSGLDANTRSDILNKLKNNNLEVYTDAYASPTGFPIKVALLSGTQSDLKIRSERTRLCDAGYLRMPFQNQNAEIRYRCPSEPIPTFLKKGGAIEETNKKACLCNALLANIGLAQHRLDSYIEEKFVTLGSDLSGPKSMITKFPSGWSAAEAISEIII